MPRRLTTRETEGGAYPLLTADDFAEVLGVVKKAGQFLSEHPSLLRPADPSVRREDHLRDVLLLALNQAFPDATGETFSYKGKADIRVLLGATDVDKVVFKSECKMWEGRHSAGEAFTQLTDRYLTFHDNRAAIILFVDGPRARHTAAADAVAQLVEHHGGERLAEDVATCPVVRFRNESGDVVDVAVVIVVTAG